MFPCVYEKGLSNKFSSDNLIEHLKMSINWRSWWMAPSDPFERFKKIAALLLSHQSDCYQRRTLTASPAVKIERWLIFK